MIKNKKNLFDSKNVFHDLPAMIKSKPISPAITFSSKFKNLTNNTNDIKQKNLASGSNITDKEGLERAYASPSNTYVIGDTLYIAGTQFGKFLSGMIPSHWGSGEFSKGGKDVWDDVSKVPVWGDVKNSTRYGEAHTAFKANPNIKLVVGHSLGGSVALELQKQYPHLASRTYGAPVFDPFGSDARSKQSNVDRYRNYLDPVSIFDRSANDSLKTNVLASPTLTHAFDNIATNYTSRGGDNTYGFKNPDGSTSLTQ